MVYVYIHAYMLVLTCVRVMPVLGGMTFVRSLRDFPKGYRLSGAFAAVWDPSATNTKHDGLSRQLFSFKSFSIVAILGYLLLCLIICHYFLAIRCACMRCH